MKVVWEGIKKEKEKMARGGVCEKRRSRCKSK